MEAPGIGYELRRAPSSSRTDTTSTGSSTLANSLHTSFTTATSTTTNTCTSQTSTHSPSSTSLPIPQVETRIEIPPDYEDSDSDPDLHDRQPPDKPQGYSGLSRMLNSDQQFLLFRRFGKLSIRNVLYLQDRLCELEEKLRERDRMEDGFHDTRRWDRDEVRRGLMEEVQKALVEYEQAISTHSKLLSYKPPSTTQSRSLRNYFSGNHPLVSEEERYHLYPHDLLSLTTDPRSPLERLIATHPTLQRLFTTPSDRRKSRKDPLVQYYSATKVRRAYRGVVLLGGLCFIVTPIVVLWWIEEMWKRLVVVVVYLVVFQTVMVTVTKAKDFEVLAATAAYSAVLVFFIGSGVGRGGTK